MSTKKEASRIQSDRTKEINQEFARAGLGCRILYTALHQFLKDSKESNLSGRLSSKLLKVVQSDPIHDLGKRCIGSGDLRLLEGFDFYLKQPMLRLLPALPEVLLDRKKCKCVVSIPPFVPEEWLSEDVTATHITISAAVLELDFEHERSRTYTSSSIPLPVQEEAGLTLEVKLPHNSLHSLMVVVGIQFQKVVNGKAYPMAGKALQVVKAEKATRKKSKKIA